MELNRFALAQQLGAVCCERGIKLAIAESCTGGAVSEVVTAVPGSSAWFLAGFVTYANESKTSMLGVDAQLISEFGAVSEPVALAMASGALQYSNADLAIAITGLAGPGGGSESKPVGTVCFALADKETNSCEALSTRFESGRKHIRRCATAFALEWFLRHITGNRPFS